MKQYSVSCRIVLNHVDQWVYLSGVHVDLSARLEPRRFAPFDYRLDFAGRSAGGLCLSVRGSAGPARIGPYPLLESLPPGWVAFSAPVPGLLLRTDRPRLAFIGISEGRSRECYRALGIASDDLAAIVEIQNARDRQPQPTEVPVGELSLDVVKLLARHATQLRVVFLEHGLHIRVPNKLHLLSDEWEVLHRYVFTGNSSGCVADTIPFVDESWGDSDDPIELPGRSLGEITARWGIRPEPPCGYDGKALLFRSVCVEDPSKFSCRYPATKQLLGRRLTVVQKPERFSSYNLQHAMEAGVVPQHGSIVVDSKVERIFLPPGRVQIAKLKGPIEFRLESGRQRAGLLCPEPLVEHFLLSAAKAARTYRLPAGLTKYQVRTADPQTDDESDLPGTFYLMSDLKSLPHRGLRQERAERKERQERLVARFGPDLPADYEKYTDQELSQYFAVKELVARGEMIDITTHPALPRGGYTLPDFVDWIKTVKPDLVMSCPITRTQYLHSATVLGDLADLPGFWKAVERTVGLSSWLRNLILDPKVRAAAMAHAI